MEHTEKLYAVRDAKGDCYAPPFVSPNKGIAMRSFMEACERTDIPWSKYPADFALYELGTYDSRSGVLTSYRVPEFVMGAVDAVPVKRLAKEPEVIS